MHKTDKSDENVFGDGIQLRRMSGAGHTRYINPPRQRCCRAIQFKIDEITDSSQGESDRHRHDHLVVDFQEVVLALRLRALDLRARRGERGEEVDALALARRSAPASAATSPMISSAGPK